MIQEPKWGEPPIGDVIARLLAERWDIDDTVRVDVDPDARALAASIDDGQQVVEVRLTYRSGAGDRDPWMLLADGLDALIGQLEEGGRRHRALPAGEGVDYLGAQFLVAIDRRVPELQRIADQLLGDS